MTHSHRRASAWFPRSPNPLCNACVNKSKVSCVPGASSPSSCNNSLASRISFCWSLIINPGAMSSTEIFGPRLFHAQEPAAPDPTA